MTEFDRICTEVGFGDLKKRDRRPNTSIKRQSVWFRMKQNGFSVSDIGRQSDRTHATIVSGINRFEGLLFVGDKQAKEVWEKIAMV